MSEIIFFSDKIDSHDDSKSKAVKIHFNVKDKDELFELFCSQLEFPEYFGENWDALYDCLADLSWIKEQKIVIEHEDIPFDSIYERRIYIQILVDLINHWNKNKEFHFMKVYFPKKNEQEIRILGVSLPP